MAISSVVAESFGGIAVVFIFEDIVGEFISMAVAGVVISGVVIFGVARVVISSGLYLNTSD